MSSLSRGGLWAYVRLLAFQSGRADKLLLACGTLAALLCGAPLPLLGRILGSLVDGFNSAACNEGSDGPQPLPPDQRQQFLSQIAHLMGYMLLVAIANFSLIYISSACWALAGERIVQRLRAAYLDAILHQELAWFDTNAQATAAPAALNAELDAVHAGVSEKAALVLTSFAYLTASSTVALLTMPALAGPLLMIVPVIVVISTVGASSVARATDEGAAHLAAAAALAGEALSHLPTVRVFGIESELGTKYRTYLAQARVSGGRKAFAAAATMGSLFGLTYGANAAAFWAGSRIIAGVSLGSLWGIGRLFQATSHPSNGAGSVYTVIFLLLDSGLVAGAATPHLQSFAQAAAAGRRLFSVLDRKSKIDSRAPWSHDMPYLDDREDPSQDASRRVYYWPRITDLLCGGLDLKFEDVSFSYPTRPEVVSLDRLSLIVPAGKTVGIVGSSGSGKSTLAKLACRLYDPTAPVHSSTDDNLLASRGGRVNLGEYDLRILHPRWVRAQIGVVPQEPRLTGETVFQAIAAGLFGSTWFDSNADADYYVAGPWVGPGCGVGEHAQLVDIGPLGGGSNSTVAAAQYGTLAGDLNEHTMSACLRLVSRGSVKLNPLSCPRSLLPSLSRIVRLVRNAAEVADAADFIASLPSELSSTIGEGGSALSGGQKMRLAIARAVVKNPRVLICDEFTAALDSRAEQSVLAALATAGRGKTTLIIAHRLATVKAADSIVVMQRGKVIEQGTHSELIAQEGVYTSLARAQNLSAHQRPEDKEPDVPITPAQVEAGSSPYSSSQEISPKSFSMQIPLLPLHSRSSEDKPAIPTRVPLSLPRKLLGLVDTPYERFLLAAGLACAATVGATYSTEAWVFGHMIGALNPCRSQESMLAAGQHYSVLFSILAVGALLAHTGSGSLFGALAERMLYKVRGQVFDALLSLPIDWFEEEATTSDNDGSTGKVESSEVRTPSGLVASLAKDTAALGGLTSSVLGTISATCINLFLGTVLGFVVSPYLAVGLVWAIPPLLAAGYVRLRVAAQFQAVHAKAYAGAAAVATDAVRSIATVQQLAAETDVSDRHAVALREPYAATQSHILRGTLWLATSLSAPYAVYAYAYWFGSRAVASGAASATQFFVVLPALLFSAQAGGQLLSFAGEFASAHHSARRVFSVLDDMAHRNNTLGHARTDRDEEAYGGDEGPECPDAPLSVTMEDVTFSYPSRVEPALRDVSLHIPPGQFAAMVGPSGSGKTTAMQLITGLRVPSSGTVLVGGEAPVAGSEAVAIVAQEPALFAGTAAWNVWLGRPGATQEEIEEACKQAGVHDVIASLPDGYTTDVGVGGSSLSGGQRQRLALARALVRNSRLLLLDESTSALDAQSEAFVSEVVANLAKEGRCTVVAIAHRLKTITEAQSIYFFDQGLLVACGDHKCLMEASERFREMALHQSLM